MRKQEKQEQKPITDISIQIAALSASFKPAYDVKSTTHWFTTEEIYEAIIQIDPGADVDKKQIHQSMLDAGFQYRIRPGSSGIEFRWMLQAR